jgi:hypothetical protein
VAMWNGRSKSGKTSEKMQRCKKKREEVVARMQRLRTLSLYVHYVSWNRE